MTAYGRAIVFFSFFPFFFNYVLVDGNVNGHVDVSLRLQWMLMG